MGAMEGGAEGGVEPQLVLVGGGAVVLKLQVQALMEQSFVQILVLVANIHPRIMNAEVEQSSMSTSLEHGLPGPKTKCNYFQ